MLYTQDRRGLRELFFRAWQQHRAGRPAEGAGKNIVAVILRHPEYHDLLDQPEQHAERDYFPELGETNPFLHLAMHIAIDEQLAIDQPPGIRTLYAGLCRHQPDEHALQHRLMECLGETLWQAGRRGTPPDARTYLDCVGHLQNK